jgi:hypothetical protein
VEFLMMFLLTVLVLGGTAVVLTRRAVLAVQCRAAELRAATALTARTYTFGPSGEVARLRRDLYRSIVSVRRALDVATATRAPVGDVPSLLARLEMAADTVDGELRLLETMRDPRQVSAALAGPRSRAQALMSAAADLSQGLLHAAGGLAVDVSWLQAECGIEAEALRAAGPPAVEAPRRRLSRR